MNPTRTLPRMLCLALLPLAISACGAGRARVDPPMLEPMVASGELPPLSERVPEPPLVIRSLDGGGYGGTLRMLDLDLRGWSARTMSQVGLLRYDQAGIEIEPDLAAGYELSEDLRELTLSLRAGHRWSDGEPFTADDILFWWEAYANHPAFEPEPFWRFDSGQMRIEKLDEQTLRFHFPEPYPVIIDRWGRSLLSTDGLRGPILPRHYLETYHLDYNPEAEALAEAEGLDSWRDLFLQHAEPLSWADTDRPSLWAWIPESRDEEGIVLVRNPYFHQIDQRGRQLPYIDRVEVRFQPDREALIASLEEGAADFEGMYIDYRDIESLETGAEVSDYALRMATEHTTSRFTIHVNQTVQDRALRAIFSRIEFRRALSLAVDREAIAEEIFLGHARPFPALPSPEHAFFDPEWIEPGIRYDPQASMRLLDELGLSVRDEQGFRLRPDGQLLGLVLQMNQDAAGYRETCALLLEDLEAVGLLSQCRGLSLASLYKEHSENDIDLLVSDTSRNTRLLRTDPRWFGFESPQEQWWARSWTAWLASEGSEGEPAPQTILDLRAQFEHWTSLPYGSEDAQAVARLYFDWFAQNLTMIGTVGLVDHPILVAERLRGVPEEKLWWGSDNNFYAAYLPAQWWLDGDVEGSVE